MSAAVKERVGSEVLELHVDRNQGVAILMALQTVERAIRKNCSYELTAKNVVKNEQAVPEFRHYVEKHAGLEISDQEALVEELLRHCYTPGEE